MRAWLSSLIIIGLLFGGTTAALATSGTSTLNILITVPSESGPPHVDPPVPDTAPSISNVVVTVGTSTAHIAWNASDNGGLTNLALVYGLTTAYGSFGNVGGTYSTNLTGLTGNTLYHYRISVTDDTSQTTNFTGTFTTDNPADVTVPVISNVAASPDVTSCTVSWNVNEPATGQVLYGLTAQYGDSVDTALSLSHSALLFNLVPSSNYHYKVVATDPSGNSASTSDDTCETLADVTPPANPSNVSLVTTTNSFEITWTNPTDPDFSGIKMVRKTGSSPTSPTDGTLIYNGTGSSFTDTSISGNITYYYTLFAYDSSNNVSSGANVDGRITSAVVNEICTNGVDDDSNGLTDCADNTCKNQAHCQAVVEICSNGIDDDSNGKTDCADSFCAGANFCNAVAQEICNNQIDDNNNGLVDCDEGSCFGFPTCKINSEVPTPTSTVSSSIKLQLSDLFFLGGKRSIAVSLSGGKVTGLAGTNLSVGLRLSNVPKPAERVTLHTNNGSYQFTLEGGSVYYSDIMFPAVGNHEAYVEVEYSDTERDTVPFQIQSLAYGTVKSSGQSVSSAQIMLLGESGEFISSGALSGVNPFSTNENGVYGWMVPNGKYKVRVTKQGYYDRETPVFTVDTNVVNLALDIIARPPDLFEDITASSTVKETISQVTKNVAAKTKAAAQQTFEKAKDVVNAVQEIKKDPEVQKAASQVIAPTAVTVAAVSTVALVSWADLIPLLRLLFLQPLMLLGHRRRSGWGQVYNTLSKIPIDLATLRLVNAEGRVIQSKVTDKQGRYAFVVNPGKYTIQVMKSGFTFPSILLANAHSDGRRTDIYHGEIIEVNEKEAVITANIPLDPVGELKKPVRLYWQRVGRFVQVTLSWVGLLITIASLYISPKWYVWLLLGMHVLLFFVFRRLAVPAKIKSWGIVYDAGTKKPVGRTVARLFNQEFNKLVSTQITDANGRYYFLAGDDKYYVTYDHPDYTTEKTGVLDLTGKSVETITVDVGLNKHGGVKPGFPPPQPETLQKDAKPLALPNKP